MVQMFRVIQRRSSLGLALETFERRAIVGQLVRKKFQGNGTMEACVLGLINNAHSSTAELFDDAVVRNRAAKYWRGIGHWRCMLRPAPQCRQSCNRGRIGPDRRASRKPRSKRAERLWFRHAPLTHTKRLYLRQFTSCKSPPNRLGTKGKFWPCTETNLLAQSARAENDPAYLIR